MSLLERTPEMFFFVAIDLLKRAELCFELEGPPPLVPVFLGGFLPGVFMCELLGN